jgi:hypothetical protein
MWAKGAILHFLEAMLKREVGELILIIYFI